MGIGFRADGWNKGWTPSWSYSGFNLFRERLAQSVGIQLREMEGFGEAQISWDILADEIKPLLMHSDCDGTMSPEECRAVAPRLRELIAPWPADDYDRQHGALLSDMMEFCAESNTDLLFC